MPAPSDPERPDGRAASARPSQRRRDPAALAALLVAAMPGTTPVACAPAHAGRDDVDAALVHDSDANVWVVLAPRTPEAGARVEAETEAVRLLAGVLPFDVPRPRADVALPRGGRAIVFPAPRGRPVDLVRLAASPGVCRSVGRSLAALHDVTTAVVERAGVPVRDAGEVRRRRLGELDRGAATGQVPPVLLERWESLLDDTSVWDFSPAVVHGDLVAERLVVTGEEVTAVLDWNDLHVGDPAQDLAWLAVGAEPETVEEVLAAYRASRHGAVDDDLLRRAVLHGEMALVRWLLHGVDLADDEVQQDARGMLEQLAGWVEAENEARRAAEESDDDEANDDEANDDEANDDEADDDEAQPDEDEPDGAHEGEDDEPGADDAPKNDDAPEDGDGEGDRRDDRGDADTADANEPGTDEPGTDEPDANEPGTDANEPGTDEPDANEPDANEPDRRP
ncbi:phosphotransferase [Jannaschia sp. R86511]|uniref:phosphotransferase n=1 Tax=Jannaschia sp. R86511 TaxID=3093853 RepID=UPI0036D41AA2